MPKLTKQSQQLNENNNNSVSAAQPQTSNAPCDVRRAETQAAQNTWRQTLCRSTRNLCHHRARASKTKKTKVNVTQRTFKACFNMTDQLLEKTRTLKQCIASSAPTPEAICHVALHASNKPEPELQKVKSRKITDCDGNATH